MADLGSITIKELYNRRFVCLQCIKIASVVDKSDPRRADAIRHYNAQLARIDAAIAAHTGKPPATVIGLQTASLSGKSKLD